MSFSVVTWAGGLSSDDLESKGSSASTASAGQAAENADSGCELFVGSRTSSSNEHMLSSEEESESHEDGPDSLSVGVAGAASGNELVERGATSSLAAPVRCAAVMGSQTSCSELSIESVATESLAAPVRLAAVKGSQVSCIELSIKAKEFVD